MRARSRAAALRPRSLSGWLTVVTAGRAAGVGRVLVTCDQDNVGSRTVIESCGGVLDSVMTLDGEPPVLRFWID